MKINIGKYRENRKVDIRIDDWDVWGADHTLALIIHPVLAKLKEVKQGSPCVDDEDVPELLRASSAPAKENEWDTDDNHHSRWEYVLDEMIWAFEQHTYDDCNDNQFHHNRDQLGMTFEDSGENGMKSIVMNNQKDPTKPAYWVDEEGRKKHYDRIAEGRRLFAKYYDALWD